jgi:hypothetical protein
MDFHIVAFDFTLKEGRNQARKTLELLGKDRRRLPPL